MEYGLIGEHLSHSFSKQIHEQLCDYTYQLCPLSKEELPTFMLEKNFKAINVTIPYKKDVIPYLDVVDSKAAAIGAVNTIVNRNGTLYGYNTDYDGFAYMLQKHNVTIANKKVLVLGNGGASAAIQAVIKDQHPRTMIVVSPSAKNGAISFDELYKNHRDVEIIINTSFVGMYPNNHQSPIQLDDFLNCEYVIDIIYNPLTTALGVQAKRKNIPFVGGLEMLIAQAVYAIHHFLQQEVRFEEIDCIYHTMLLEKLGISLIGMPSCGKSTIAKQLAKHLNKQCIDLDVEIEKTTQKTIPELFHEYKEEGFRKWEHEITLEQSKNDACIISCGGGIILNKKNMDALSQNTIVIYIKRDLESLLCDSSRPLSKNKDALLHLYNQRKDLYVAYADYIIENNTTIQDCVNQIIQCFTEYIQS